MNQLDKLSLSSRGNLTQACIIPFVLYLLGSALLGRLDPIWYPLGYGGVALVTGLAWWWLWPAQRRHLFIPIHPRIGWGVLVGVVGIAGWIALSHLQLERYLFAYLPEWLQPGERASFNPLAELEQPWTKVAFVLVRIAGIAVLVPLAEELFWRGFLLRWTIDPEWEQIPLGTFTWPSCLVVTAMFTLAHPEWLAAASYCLLLNGLLYWKRDLWQCIIAHGVSNLLLVIYVLITGHWWLW